MDTRNTTRVHTSTNAGTVQSTDNTEHRTGANGSLPNAANAAENGANNTKEESDAERGNSDPSAVEGDGGGGSEQNNEIQGVTQNATVRHVDLTGEANGAEGGQGRINVAENPTPAEAQAQVARQRQQQAQAQQDNRNYEQLSERLNTFEDTFTERMDAMLALVSGINQNAAR